MKASPRGQCKRSLPAVGVSSAQHGPRLSIRPPSGRLASLTTPDDDVAAWAAARDLIDLGELTAQWLEGHRSYHPGYVADGPDEEASELVETLAGLNRAGFVTENSQPGIPLENGCAQRACVSGYCSGETAETLAFACLATDLLCLVAWPGTSSLLHVPVTMDDGRAFTWEGMSSTPDILVNQWAGVCSSDGVLAILEAWQVAVIDPVWGRNDLLWPTLREALARPPKSGALPAFE